MPNLNLVISTFGLKTAKNGFQVILAVLFSYYNMFYFKNKYLYTTKYKLKKMYLKKALDCIIFLQ